MCQHAGVKAKIDTASRGRAGAKSRSEAELRFAQVLLKRASAPDLRKTERTRLRLLASIAGQLSDGWEHADLRVADVAAAADLARGKHDAVPAVIVRGIRVTGDGAASDLVMSAERDLFR